MEFGYWCTRLVRSVWRRKREEIKSTALDNTLTTGVVLISV
jgi:hypothetical protein